MKDATILINNISAIDQKLSYLEDGLKYTNIHNQLSMKSLSDNLEKNQPLDLDLPTDFDFTHKHYQIMTLVTAGVTTLIIIFFIKILQR